MRIGIKLWNDWNKNSYYTIYRIAHELGYLWGYRMLKRNKIRNIYFEKMKVRNKFLWFLFGNNEENYI